jgi:predicted transcriptional regulator
MAADPTGLTPQELVQQVKASYGYTWAELGERLGRSEKMLRKVAKGESRGEAYRQALVDLYTHGEVRHLPARRRGKDGHIVPVRAKHGAETATVVPKDTVGAYKDLPKRGKFTVSRTDFPEGGRQIEVTMPKTKRAKGRTEGVHELERQIRNISKAQRRGDKRVKLQVIYDAGEHKGRVMEIGSKSGYHASDILADVKKDHDGDMTAWILSQSTDRYPEFDIGRSPIVSVRMTVFNAVRSKGERKAQDEAGTRRRKWRR